MNKSGEIILSFIVSLSNTNFTEKMKVIPNSQIRKKTIGKGRKFQFCTDCLQQHPTDLDNNRTPQKIHLPFIVPAPTKDNTMGSNIFWKSQ
mgnify:CR=1 FL=1